MPLECKALEKVSGKEGMADTLEPQSIESVAEVYK